MKTRLIATAAAVAFLLGACSNDPEPIKAAGPAEVKPASESEPTPTPAPGKPAEPAEPGGKQVPLKDGGVDWCANVDPASFVEPPAPFTQQQYADAYCEAVTFIAEHGLTRQLAAPGGWDKRDELIFASYFTERMQKFWATTFNRALEQTPEQNSADDDVTTVSLISGLGHESDDLSYIDGEPQSLNFSWSPAIYWARETPADRVSPQPIGLTITFKNDLLLEQKGAGKVVVPWERTLNFAMVQAGDDEWLIDDVDGSYKFGDSIDLKTYTDQQAAGDGAN